MLDFLVESPEGYLVTTPPYTLENAFVHPARGEPMQLACAPTMDVQIIREIFQNTIRAAELLGADPAFRDTLPSTLVRLPPVRVGADGTISEWIEDYEEVEPGCTEMLLQSHAGYLDLLPALPDKGADGRATGLRAMGGHTVDLTWHDGALTNASIPASVDGPLRVHVSTPVAVYADGHNVDVEHPFSSTVASDAHAGTAYTLRPTP